MASWSTRVAVTALLGILVLLLATLGDASVTWRRVTKPTHRPTPKAVTQSTTTTTIKSQVVWKRSTIARRSTDAVERKHRADHTDEFDEIEEAGSRQAEYLSDEGLENESEVTPLVPGSRPGFWFDSSRKKKPSSLLRPQLRRNSLFPTRSSATTTSAPTIIAVTPLTVIPRTVPPVTLQNVRNASIRHFGRHKSTKSPIAFRRRLKTTKVAKIPSTTAIPDEEEYRKENSLTEPPNIPNNRMNIEREREDSPKSPVALENESNDLRPRPLNRNFRRRPYNESRLSWTRQNKQNSRTTPVPQQLTTTTTEKPSSASDYEVFSQKTTRFPKTRTRSKTKSSTAKVAWSRSRQTTVTPTTSTKSSKRFQEVTTSRSALRKVISKKRNQNLNKKTDEEVEELVEKSTHEIAKDFGIKRTTSERPKPKIRTTVEPYFITRDYGQIVTAIPELKKEKEYVAIIPTESTKEEEDFTTIAPEPEKDKKHMETKVTEAPKIYSTINEKIQTTQMEEDYDIASIDSSGEDIEIYKSKHTTTLKPTTTLNSKGSYPEKLSSASEITTTTRPATQPVMPIIDPNSTSYVVWSLGQGGSGWSYQNHGGEVKWSAQNSEAEGDKWSVVGKEEKGSSQSDFDNPWVPIRNISLPVRKSEKIITKMIDEKPVHSSGTRSYTEKTVSSLTYLPEFPHKNETILNIEMSLGDAITPYKLPDLSFSQFYTPSDYLISPITQNAMKSTDFANSTIDSNIDTLSQNFIQGPQSITFVSQTPFPISPTLADEYNEQVEGIINQYPIIPNYPYIAEMRETYNNKPAVDTDPSIKHVSVQELITQNQELNVEKDTTTPIPFTQQQFTQELQTTSYPTSFPQTETTSPYLEIITKDSGEIVTNQLPILNTDYTKYLSRIPPELAKAVVNAKKWQVTGSGGDEGWSLLNEDGVLEWKIHNVDGKWQINSAEQLLNMKDAQQAEKVEDLQPEVTNSGYNTKLKKDSPKVWTLDDDYAKWRAISAERGSPIEESSEEASKSSEEYDYESKEFNSDYYTDDEYYNNEPFSEGITSYNPNEDFGSKPLWGDGENQMIRNYPKNDYSQFAGTIEFANSKEDAISAWKSLIAQQGQWKFYDSMSNPQKTSSQEKQKNSQTMLRNADRRISTETPEERFKNEGRKQKSRMYEASKDQHEKMAMVSINPYDNRGKDLFERAQPTAAKQKTQTKDHTIFEKAKSSYGYINEPSKQRNDKDVQEQSEETNQHYDVENIKTRNTEKARVHIREKDHSKIESLISKLETIQKEAKGRAVIDLTDLLRQMKARRNVTSFVPSQNRNSKLKQKINNQQTVPLQENHKNTHTNPQPIQLNYSQQSSKGLQQNVYSDDNEKSSDDLEDSLRLLRFKYTQQNDDFYKQDIRTSDNSKSPDDILENLRSVILKRYSQQNPEKSDDLQRQISYPESGKKSSSSIKGNPRKNQLRTNLPEQNHEVSNYKQISYSSSEDKLSDKNDGYFKSYNSDGKSQNDRVTNSDSNYRQRNSKQRNQAKRRRRPTLRSQNQRIEKSSSRQNVSLSQQERRYPPARPTEQYIRNKYVNNKPERKDTSAEEVHSAPERKYSSYSLKQDAIYMIEKSDSSSSEETIADYLKARNAYRSEKRTESQNVLSSSLQKQEPVHKFEKVNAFGSEEANADYPKRRNTYPEQESGLLQNAHPIPPRRQEPKRILDKSDSSSYEETIDNYSKSRNAYYGPRYSEPRNKYPSYSQESRITRNTQKGDSSSSEKIIVDLNDGKQKKRSNDAKRRVPPQKKARRPPHPAPIVLKGETDLEDEENGTKKSRKIIVIDYAGIQKKKNPIDKKDLELIIRNVKHRRSEVLEDYVDSESEK